MKPDLRTSGLQPYKIETVYAAVVIGKDGTEGIPAIMDPDSNVLLPLMFSAPEKLEVYKEHIARMAVQTGVTVSIRTFALVKEEMLNVAPGMSDEEAAKTGQRYVEQIKEMAKRGRQWIKANPDAVPKVQFNFPQDMTLISDLTRAEEMGALSYNWYGRQLIIAMCEGMMGQPEEPTPFMVQTALELATSEQDEFEGER